MAEPVHIQSGILLSNTSVQITPISASTPVLIILATHSTNTALPTTINTPLHLNSAGVTLNTFNIMGSYTSTYFHVKYFISKGAYPIRTDFGDQLILQGNADPPIFWAAWKLSDYEPESAWTNSYIPNFSTAYYSATGGITYRATIQTNDAVDTPTMRGAVIEMFIVDNGYIPSTVRPFSMKVLDPLNSGATISSGDQVQISSNLRYYFVSHGKEITATNGLDSNWRSICEWTRPTGGVTVQARAFYMRIPYCRTNDSQKARSILNAVGRTSRY